MADLKVWTLEEMIADLVSMAVNDGIEVEIPHGLVMMFRNETGALSEAFKYRYEKPASGGLKRCIARYEPETLEEPEEQEERDDLDQATREEFIRELEERPDTQLGWRMQDLIDMRRQEQ